MTDPFCRGTCIGAVLALLATSALAGPENVTFPEGYQESAKAGAPLASGSVIAMEVYKAELDTEEEPVVGEDGFFVPGELAAIAVMESRDGWGEDYPEAWRNGSWEYAAFTGDGAPVDRDYQPCFECHKPLHEADYLFSFDALKDFAAAH
jgi:hypothetical protein